MLESARVLDSDRMSLEGPTVFQVTWNGLRGCLYGKMSLPSFHRGPGRFWSWWRKAPGAPLMSAWRSGLVAASLDCAYVRVDDWKWAGRLRYRARSHVPKLLPKLPDSPVVPNTIWKQNRAIAI